MEWRSHHRFNITDGNEMLLLTFSVFFFWVTIKNFKMFYSVTRILYLLYREEIHINEKKKWQVKIIHSNFQLQRNFVCQRKWQETMTLALATSKITKQPKNHGTDGFHMFHIFGLGKINFMQRTIITYYAWWSCTLKRPYKWTYNILGFYGTTKYSIHFLTSKTGNADKIKPRGLCLSFNVNVWWIPCFTRLACSEPHTRSVVWLTSFGLTYMLVDISPAG